MASSSAAADTKSATLLKYKDLRKMDCNLRSIRPDAKFRIEFGDREAWFLEDGMRLASTDKYEKNSWNLVFTFHAMSGRISFHEKILNTNSDGLSFLMMSASFAPGEFSYEPFYDTTAKLGGIDIPCWGIDMIFNKPLHFDMVDEVKRSYPLPTGSKFENMKMFHIAQTLYTSGKSVTRMRLLIGQDIQTASFTRERAMEVLAKTYVLDNVLRRRDEAAREKKEALGAKAAELRRQLDAARERETAAIAATKAAAAALKACRAEEYAAEDEYVAARRALRAHEDGDGL